MTQTTRPLYLTLAECTAARNRCAKNGNQFGWWVEKWNSQIRSLVSLLPSGSGIDAGTTVADITDDRIVMHCSFHHMNDQGVYDGWTEHTIRVTPGWGGITVKVSGSNRNEILDHLHEVYHTALTTHVVWEEHGADGEGSYDFVREEPSVFTGEYKRQGRTINSPDGFPLVDIHRETNADGNGNLTPVECDALAWYFTSCLNRPGLTLHAIKTAYLRNTDTDTDQE